MSDLRSRAKGASPEAPAEPTGIPTPAKAYLAAVILLGLAALAHSGLQLASGQVSAWLGLAALTVVTSSLAIRLPVPGGRAGKLAITVSDCFVFISLLLFGPPAAAVTAAVDGLVTSLRCRLKRPERFAFNVAVVALDAYLVGSLFNLVTGSTPPVSDLLSPRVLAGLALSAAFYFLFNALLLAAGMSLVSGRTLSRIWESNFAWTSPSTLANMLAALFFTLAVGQPNPAASLSMAGLAAACLCLSALNLLRGRNRLLNNRLAGEA